MRMLRANFNNLSRTIGNIFLPIVAKALPYINAFVNALQRLAQWIVKLLGFDDFDWGGLGSKGGGSDVMSDILDDVEGTSDALASATDNAKKLNKAIRAFDELNVINTSEQDSKAGSGASGVGNATGLIQDAFDKMLEEYQSAWDKAFDEMSQKQQGLANNLVASIKKAWNNSNGEDIGKAIANWFNRGINWVNSNSSMFENNLKKISTIMATTVNGFTYNFDWSGFGTAIGNSLDSYLKSSTNFFEKTDFSAIGKGLANALNGFVNSGVPEDLLKNIGSKLRAIIELAWGFVTTFDFPGLGDKIGRGLNGAFSEMNKVDVKTGLNGWQKLGKTISTTLAGVTQTITTALETVKWVQVGQAMADFISSIDYEKVAFQLGGLAEALLEAIVKTLVGFFKDHPIMALEIITGKFVWKIVGNIGKSMWDAIFTKLADKLKIPHEVSATVKVVLTTILSPIMGITDIVKKLYKKIKDNCGTVSISTIIKIAFSIFNLPSKAKELKNKIVSGIKDNVFKAGFLAISIPLKIALSIFKLTGGDSVAKKIVDTITKYLPKAFGGNGSSNDFGNKIWAGVGYATSLALKGPAGTFLKILNGGSKADLFGDIDGGSGLMKGVTQASDAVDKVWTDKEIKLTAKASVNKQDIHNSWLTNIANSWVDKTSWLKASSEKLKGADVQSAWLKKIGANWFDKTAKLNATSQDLSKDAVKTTYNNKVGSVWKDKTATLGVKVDANPIEKAKQTFESLKKTWKDMNAEAKVKFTITSEDDIKKFINENLVKNLNRTYGYHIPQFATGGIVPKGELFVANEAGPEYVGSFGGKTGVANTQQIVEGISLGVSEANAETNALLRETNRLLTDIYGKDMGISQDDIFSSVRTSNQRYKLANGVSAFA